jgi:hypothetical protein
MSDINDRLIYVLAEWDNWDIFAVVNKGIGEINAISVATMREASAKSCDIDTEILQDKLDNLSPGDTTTIPVDLYDDGDTWRVYIQISLVIEY